MFTVPPAASRGMSITSGTTPCLKPALSHKEAEAWRSLPRAVKLNERYRKEFRAAGWEFGQGVINVIRCPGCPKDAKPNLERVQTKTALEDLMGDDEDGLAATFEDYYERRQ